MTANIVNLSSLDEQDEEYIKFVDELKEDNANAIFLIEKKNGEVHVGCNFEDRRDLVYAIYKLQNLAQVIANGGAEE
jgi:hypothetical protein